MDTASPKVSIKEVIRRAGGPSKLGKAVKRSHSTVLAWTRIPFAHVPVVSEITGISRHDLCPSLWQADSEQASA